jgi:DNA polymerase-3 subunit delta'
VSDAGDVWDDVVGQGPAVAQLRAAVDQGPVHAYLFAGPPGSTKLQAARAFSAVLLTGSEDRDTRAASLVLRGEHPDVHEIRREGATILKPAAQEVVRTASLAPVEGARKVMILEEFHLLSADGAGVLLKVIEEPPESTTFIVLCDFVPDELITISSRCVRVEFRPIPADVIAARLLIEGSDPASATVAAKAAHGDLDRARVLATDPELAARRRAFAESPARLDGSGAAAMATAAELLTMIDAAAQPMIERQAAELAEFERQVEELGTRGGRPELVSRHKRQLRRYRTDELRDGLAAMAATYRDVVVSDGRGAREAAEAVHRIHGAMEALTRNANDRLLLESLLWSLPALAAAP